AVGLHWLKAQQPQEANDGRTRHSVRAVVDKPGNGAHGVTRPTKPIWRDDFGEPAELFLILPPNLDQAIARGRVMLVFEARWAGGRGPLNALPKGRMFAFSAQDNAVLDQVETLTNGERPAVLQLELKDFAPLLPKLVGHERISLGKSADVTVTQ